ncbi:hypothetical protein CGLO_01783 [Colletotrichum gloeosporioides Cg-14]|uniref:Uncharacterized protein n=1 Tax=Colletotrichum gloeosporioides (strain Cg-14) TaxID=1237896 RepID=T0KR56_COLGC|nr:hypothetical protein CGLO_01783 [Colletotrichum gloeosporioides Cg-14]
MIQMFVCAGLSRNKSLVDFLYGQSLVPVGHSRFRPAPKDGTRSMTNDFTATLWRAPDPLGGRT